jgi:hypothetical protein
MSTIPPSPTTYPGDRRPDAVIVADPLKPPTQDNLKAVVDVKLPGDRWRGTQKEDFQEIAGDPEKVVEVNPKNCQCEEKPKPEPVPVPVPIVAPKPKQLEFPGWLALVAIGVAAVAVVAAAVALAPAVAAGAAAVGLAATGAAMFALFSGPSTTAGGPDGA